MINWHIPHVHIIACIQPIEMLFNRIRVMDLKFKAYFANGSKTESCQPWIVHLHNMKDINILRYKHSVKTNNSNCNIFILCMPPSGNHLKKIK